ncbi:MAG: OB-fold domain-containing protein [Rhodospirillales bacterium]|nr:OB-fold domain-containing protein [Rhodospirillales bacterium]
MERDDGPKHGADRPSGAIGVSAAKQQSGSDSTFFDPDLLEVPADGSPPYLKGYRCRKCGHLDFPRPSPCPHCWGEQFETVPLSRRGVLYSFSDIFVGQAGMKVPYVFGYIDLPEDLRIFAQLDGGVGSFRCDDPVELTVGAIRSNRDGLPLISYKFRKIDP